GTRLGPKALEQGLRDSRRQGFEQVVAALVDLTDGGGDLRVVHGVREPVGRAAVADLELDVVHEHLAPLPLVRLGPVEPSQLEPAQLDDHGASTTARAAARASPCSRTSRARMVGAPRSYATTAAPIDAATVPVGEPVSAPSELLRDRPIRIGRPRAASSGSRRTSSKLCAAVLPNPMPGSRQSSSSRMPAETASASRSARKRFTSETTSS